ncbi:jg21821 [Pararge aegeria aegeria]|uniref:Jg21821 protein n=1 Tax=Pararge aegeria aegeria TaxID=348720 RepID=A0A8S4S380_9NEOP|nr:jg21821 [Pararge aegeria aegeria]
MTPNESLGAAENKRPGTVDFGAPYKRSMSSSGQQTVELMMMMNKTLGPQSGRLSVGPPPAHWTDDLQKIAGSGWMRKLEVPCALLEELCPAVDTCGRDNDELNLQNE